MPPRCLPVLQVGSVAPVLTWGQIDSRAGKVAGDAVLWATRAALRGDVAALVTAPLHKEALHAAGAPYDQYPGHTELLQDEVAHYLGVPVSQLPVRMMLANEDLRTVLVSIHVSLRQALDAITQEQVAQTLRITDASLTRLLGRRPRIAVAGVNPHAGEGGLFGREEIDVLQPCVKQARQEGLDVQGPLPPDTVFMRARNAPGHPGAFDVVVAMYHDQGLIPVKYMGLAHGVNVTLGLPFVRTSVDHGTAFDIAGTGRADHASLACALRQAAAMVQATRTGASARTQRPDFIFMLTQQDRTIADARERLREVLAQGVRHVGFKDIGLPLPELHALARDIRAGGARVYLEVVSLDEASEVASARAAVELGVDVLMGGTRPEAVLPVLRGSGIAYYPFPGKVSGHPSVLSGPVQDIVASARRMAGLDGVHGLDLLAYRFHGDVPALIKAVCDAVDKPVVVAGSIDRSERIAAVLAGGAAGFTIGTAAFEETFPAARPGLAAQLQAIQALVD